MTKATKLIRLPDGWIDKYPYSPKYNNLDVKLIHIGGLFIATLLCLFSVFIVIATINSFTSKVITRENPFDIEIIIKLIGQLGLILYVLFMAGGGLQ